MVLRHERHSSILRQPLVGEVEKIGVGHLQRDSDIKYSTTSLVTRVAE